MTDTKKLTAAEVVAYVKPIAALLGIEDISGHEAFVILTRRTRINYFRTDDAAALILGLIVAKCDTTLEMDYVGVMIQEVDSDLLRCAAFDSKDRLGSRFKGFCHAFARAHGLSPAPTTEDTTNG